MIKLVITDMDGTFLNSKGDFNRELFKKTKELMNSRGVLFAPCTGKQCERVENLFGEDSKDLWILGDSATRIKYNGEFVFESLLSNQLGLDIIKKLEEISLEYTIIACTPDGAVIKNGLNDTQISMVRGSYQKVLFVDDFSEITSDFVKITIYDDQLRCFETKEKLSEFFNDAYIVASEAAWIDITNYNIHKGTTVKRLQEMLNVTSEETMVFGDGINDIELMEAGKYSFAMRNGFDLTKEAAAFITGTNDQDSVLHTISAIVSLQPSYEVVNS